jgi:hypothetical protein
MQYLRFRSKERHAMKTFVSTGPAFFAAALVITLSFGCGEAAEGETGSSTLGQSVEASNRFGHRTTMRKDGLRARKRPVQ